MSFTNYISHKNLKKNNFKLLLYHLWEIYYFSFVMIKFHSVRESLRVKEKVLIIGGSGQIGKELYSYLKKKI